jgi:hypothetical protein
MDEGENGTRWTIPRARVAGIVCGWGITYAVTEEGKLFSWGTGWKLGIGLERMDKEEIRKKEDEEKWESPYPFRVALPLDNSKKVSWDKIFLWLFLGHKDSSSKLFVLPIEAIFHVVNVYWK